MPENGPENTKYISIKIALQSVLRVWRKERKTIYIKLFVFTEDTSYCRNFSSIYILLGE